jgi:hypothetical protein
MLNLSLHLVGNTSQDERNKNHKDKHVTVLLYNIFQIH